MENNEALETATQEVVEEVKEEVVESQAPQQVIEAETPNKVYEELRKANNKIQELETENANLKRDLEKVAELEKQIEELKNSNDSMNSQIKASHNNSLLESLGIDTKYAEDIVALIIGKGEEVNDETITKYANEHNEWKKTIIETEGVRELGAIKSNAETSDKEKFHNWWNS